MFSGVFLVNLTIFFFLILLYIVLIFFKDYYCSILVYHFLPLCNIEILRPIQYFLCFYLIKVILFLLVNKDERGFWGDQLTYILRNMETLECIRCKVFHVNFTKLVWLLSFFLYFKKCIIFNWYFIFSRSQWFY